MATASEIINKATSYIGTKESPPNSNNVIFNTHYYGTEVRGSAYPWCAAFVWDVFRMVNASNLFFNGLKTAYCPAIESWAKNSKQWCSNTQGQAGDICLMCFSGNSAEHVGIVESRNADGSYNVIEGNTSIASNDNGGSVMRRTRGTSVIRGFARPKYAESTSETISINQNNNRSIISEGQEHANNFADCKIAIDGIRGNETKKAGIKVLQSALNLDYKSNLNVDGIWGIRTNTALGRHYVMKGEKQYMVTALEILLMLKNYNPNGVECPGIFGSRLESCTRKYQADNNLTVDGIAGVITFKSLLS